MEITKTIIENAKVEIEVSEEERYESRILFAEKGKMVMVEMPPIRIGQKTRYIILKEDEEVTISIITDRGVFSFTGRIAETFSDREVPCFTIKYPAAIEVIQRRNFSRVPINVPVDLKKMVSGSEKGGEENLLRENKGVTINLGGGGFYVMTLAEYDDGDIINTNFELPNRYVCGEIMGEIRRKDVIVTEGKGKRFGYGLSFMGIDECTRKAIVEYLDDYEESKRITEKEVSELLKNGL